MFERKKSSIQTRSLFVLKIKDTFNALGEDGANPPSEKTVATLSILTVDSIFTLFPRPYSPGSMCN